MSYVKDGENLPSPLYSTAELEGADRVSAAEHTDSQQAPSEAHQKRHFSNPCITLWGGPIMPADDQNMWYAFKG